MDGVRTTIDSIGASRSRSIAGAAQHPVRGGAWIERTPPARSVSIVASSVPPVEISSSKITASRPATSPTTRPCLTSVSLTRAHVDDRHRDARALGEAPDAFRAACVGRDGDHPRQGRVSAEMLGDRRDRVSGRPDAEEAMHPGRVQVHRQHAVRPLVASMSAITGR